MHNHEFISWLRGFIEGVDTDRRNEAPSLEAWTKLKNKLDDIDKPVNGDSQTTYTPTPVWYPNTSITALSAHVSTTGTNKSLLTEDEKVL